MKTKRTLNASVLLLTLSMGTSFAQDGSLDPLFGTSGKVVTPIGGIADEGRCTAIQADGKILVAGYTNNGTDIDFAILRYNTDGSLDMSFDGDGIVTTDFGGYDNEIYAMAIQDDGKIVVAGATYNGSNMDFALARYKTDGTPDSTFDADGKLKTDVSGSTDFAYGLIIQPDQKIIACGSSYNGTSDDFSMVRYNSDGSPDASFDSDGIVMLDFANSMETAQAIALQADGKIVLAGWTGSYPTGDYAIARFETDGALDNTFDTDGKLVLDISSTNDEGKTVLIQDDGKIVIAGSSGLMFQPPFLSVVRLNPSGTLDNTFNSTGKATFDLFTSTAESASSLAQQSDGKLVIGGTKSTGGSGDFLLLRLLNNGSLDNSFDSDGYVTTDFSGDDDVAKGMVIQQDQYIVLAGVSNLQFAAARYQVDLCSLNANIMSTGSQLSTDISSATSYQWIDCNNNNAAISGATGQTFNPPAGGNYAVVVTVGTCVDTTDCIDFECSFNPSVTVSGNTMTADVHGAIYQWIDCDSGTPLTGETGEVYNPSATGNYAVIITVDGCQDTSHCELFTCSLPITVTNSGTQLSADVASANYQWVDCANAYAEIPGATLQTFEPLTDGQYAVVVELNGCIDTSDCVTVFGLGVSMTDENKMIIISPNPTNGSISVNLGEYVNQGSVRIITVNGQVMSPLSGFSGSTLQLDLSEFPTGVYILELYVDEVKTHHLIQKN